jgi:rod shape-determining protein MreD
VTPDRLQRFGRTTVLVVVAVLLQVTLVADLSLLGVRPELLLLVIGATALVAGPSKGCIVGFWAGLAYDMFLQTPFGMVALVYSIVGYGAGQARQVVVDHHGSVRAGLLAGTTVVGVVLHASVALLLDEAAVSAGRVLWITIVAGFVNGALARPAARVVAWAVRDDERGVLR